MTAYDDEEVQAIVDAGKRKLSAIELEAASKIQDWLTNNQTDERLRLSFPVPSEILHPIEGEGGLSAASQIASSLTRHFDQSGHKIAIEPSDEGQPSVTFGLTVRRELIDKPKTTKEP